MADYSTTQKLQAEAIVDEMVRQSVGGSTPNSGLARAITENPNYTDGSTAPLVIDRFTGGLKVYQRNLEIGKDSVIATPIVPSVATNLSISSTNATYTQSAAIDLAYFNRISILPQVTTSGGTTGYYKILWSEDGTNFFETTTDTLGAASNGEVQVTKNILVHSFSSGSTGYKNSSAVSLLRIARYAAIAQRTDGTASITLTTSYQYQLL